jgi:hypothetical protein
MPLHSTYRCTGTGYSCSHCPAYRIQHVVYSEYGWFTYGVFEFDTSTVLGTLCIVYSEKSVHSMSTCTEHKCLHVRLIVHSPEYSVQRVVYGVLEFGVLLYGSIIRYNLM